MCRSSPHLQLLCPKIIIFGTLLKNDNGPAKDSLISYLYTFNIGVAIRDVTANRIIMNNIPKSVRSAVIH